MNYSTRSEQIEPSATLSISERATELQESGTDIIDFGAGEPDFPTPDPVKDAGIQAITDNYTHYTAASGSADLKAAIQEKFNQDQGIEYNRSEITVGSGAKHVLFNLMASTINSGDEVILFAPYWVSYPNQIRFFDGTPTVIDTMDNQFLPPIDQVKNAISPQTKLLVLNSPSNPTGVIYPDERIREIAELCADNDVLLVSDEIYEKLDYSDSPHRSPVEFSDRIRENTILVNGVSKAYAMTGWRIGFAAGPEPVIQRMNTLMGHSTSNPCSISQRAAINALELSDDEIQPMIDEFRERRDLVYERLNEIEPIHCEKPKGAFYAFPDVNSLIENHPEIDNDHQLVMTLLDEANIATVHGSAFGANGYIRLSFANSRERIENGLNRLKEWCKNNII